MVTSARNCYDVAVFKRCSSICRTECLRGSGWRISVLLAANSSNGSFVFMHLSLKSLLLMLTCVEKSLSQLDGVGRRVVQYCSTSP